MADAVALPHSLETERAVLGSLLDGRDSVAIHTVREHLEHPLLFFSRNHRFIYTACLDLDDKGLRIDLGSVAELLARYPFALMVDRVAAYERAEDIDGLDRTKLRGWGRRGGEESASNADGVLGAVGGYAALTEMVTQGSAISLARSCQLLRDLYQKRRLIESIGRLSDVARQTPQDFREVLGNASQMVMNLGKLDRTSQIHSIGTVAAEVEAWLANRQTEDDTGLMTGIAPLDKALGYLRPGGLYILAARPGVGKTSLALKMLTHIVSRQKVPTLMVSLEVDRQDLLKKIMSAEAAVDFGHIESGSLDEAESQRISDAMKQFPSWTLSFLDSNDLTVHGLRSMVRRLHAETNGGLGLVVIDYIGLFSSARPDATEYEKVTEASRVLKVLARELRIPILALSQLNRESEKGSTGGREPRLADLRGSGSVEQDADAVIFIHRVKDEDGGQAAPSDAPRAIKLLLEKNRFGPTGSADMLFYPATMQFELTAHPDRKRDDERHEHGNAPARSSTVPYPNKPRVGQNPSPAEDLFQ